jgi:acetolactate synthase-1/3 small subunit
MKVHVKDASVRAEIMQLAESYSAKIADATLDSVVLELTAEPQKIDRFVELMMHFGVKQLVRTGVTAIGLNASRER